MKELRALRWANEDEGGQGENEPDSVKANDFLRVRALLFLLFLPLLLLLLPFTFAAAEWEFAGNGMVGVVRARAQVCATHALERTRT